VFNAEISRCKEPWAKLHSIHLLIILFILNKL
jgi:hypothetical protein